MRKDLYRADLQYMRGIAVILVLLFHAKAPYFGFGYVGVDIFFLISGYVVTEKIIKLYSDNDGAFAIKFWVFVKRRVWRLAPPLAAVVSAFTIICIFLAPQQQQEKILGQGFYSIFMVGNFGAYKFQGDYFSSLVNPFVHTWSLGVEMQLYLTIPVIAYFCLAVQRRLLKASIEIGLLSIYFLTFITSALLYVLSDDDLSGAFLTKTLVGFQFYSPLHRAWEFCFGGGIFLLNNTSVVLGKNWRLTRLVSKPIFAGFFTCVLVSSVSNDLKLCLSAILTSGLLVESRILEKLKGKVASTFKYVGDRSYSIYLIHMPLAFVIEILLPNESEMMEFIRIVSKISLALILGSFLFLCIEKRFRWQADLRPIPHRQSFVLLATPLLSLSLMSNVNSNGWLISKVSGVESYDTLSWNANCDLNTYEIPCAFMTGAENNNRDELRTKKNILLIGDSQAITYSKALTRFAIRTDQTLIVFTRQACPFLLREDTASRNFKSDLRLDIRCLRHNDKILEFAKVNQIDKVIYAQGSPTFYLGNRENRSDDSKQYTYQSIHNLHKLGVPISNIIIVGYGPEIRNEILNRLSYILGYRANFSHETFIDNVLLEKVAKEFGFKTLNILNLICPYSRCSFLMNGNYVMQDSHHLSSSGAELVSRELIKLLRN